MTVHEQDGRVLVNCKGMCPQDQVVAELRTRGLWPAREPGPRPIENIITYDYVDEANKLLFQVVRRPGKQFVQRRPDGHGGWAWNLDGARRVLYRLPEVLAADPSKPVYICEGEKDVDRLWALGLVATCNPHGAGKWRHEYAELLRGRRVIVLADNDDPGRDHATVVARSLEGIATRVSVLELPGLPEKGDVSDWLDAGGTVEQLGALIEVAELQAPAARFRGVTLTELRTRPRPSYVVDRLLQADTVAVLEGVDGTYKTFLTLAWAHCIALGLPWLGRPVQQGRVLYLLGEGSRGLPKRADAWQIVNLGARQDVPNLLFVVDDMPQLWKGDASAVIAANPGPFVLVVVDTLARSLLGGNENLQQDMGQFIDGCDQLRRAYDGACVLPNHHLNAAGGSRGSTSLPGALHTRLRLERQGNTRSVVLSVGKQRDDEPVQPITLVARTVELDWTDEQGRPETSLVLEIDESAAPILPKALRLSATAEAALDALEELGEATYAQWRDRLGLPNTTFRRVRTELVTAGLVKHEIDRYFSLRATRAKQGPLALDGPTQNGATKGHTLNKRGPMAPVGPDSAQEDVGPCVDGKEPLPW